MTHCKKVAIVSRGGVPGFSSKIFNFLVFRRNSYKVYFSSKVICFSSKLFWFSSKLFQSKSFDEKTIFFFHFSPKNWVLMIFFYSSKHLVYKIYYITRSWLLDCGSKRRLTSSKCLEELEPVSRDVLCSLGVKYYRFHVDNNEYDERYDKFKRVRNYNYSEGSIITRSIISYNL